MLVKKNNNNNTQCHKENYYIDCNYTEVFFVVCIFDCDSRFFKKRLRSEMAQVSWRCAGRRPSVRLYGVFLKSEAQKIKVDFQPQLNMKHAAHVRFKCHVKFTRDDVLQSAVLAFTHLRLHLPLL